MKMMRAGGLALAVALLLALPAAAAEQKVTFKSGDETVTGLLYTPDKPGPAPGVLVIHEWWGLDDWVKQQAQNLAKEGYAALAVDLYRGKVTNKQEEAHQLMMGTPPDRAVRDLKAAYAFLQSRPEVRKDRIGVIGWCMGGRYAMELATQEPGLGGGGRVLRRAADRRRRDREDQGAGARQLRRRGQGPLTGSGEGVRGGDEDREQAGGREDLRGRRPRVREREQPLEGLPRSGGQGRVVTDGCASSTST